MEEDKTVIGRQKTIDSLALVFHEAIVEYQKEFKEEVTIAEVVHAFYNLVFTWGKAYKTKEFREEMEQAIKDRQGMPFAPFGSG
jgi:hypothetical protein